MAHRRSLVLALVCGLAVAGCSSTSSSPGAPATASPVLTVGPTSAPTAPQTSRPSASHVSAPAFNQPWATAALTDVETGAEFRIADLAGPDKVVFVETMATWCPNCLAQQRDLGAAYAQGLDPARVELVELDVDPSESPAELAHYRDQNGFDFRYAVAGADVSRALAADFGDVVLDPSSVNLIVLGTDGTVTHTTGRHGPDGIISLAADHGG